MQFDFGLLCDAAQVAPDGKVYILGGGFSTLIFPALPATARFTIVAGFRLRQLDLQNKQSFEIRVVDGEGISLITPITCEAMLQQRPGGQVGDEINLPFVVPVGIPIQKPGAHAVEFWAVERLISHIRFSVAPAPISAGWTANSRLN